VSGPCVQTVHSSSSRASATRGHCAFALRLSPRLSSHLNTERHAVPRRPAPHKGRARVAVVSVSCVSSRESSTCRLRASVSHSVILPACVLCLCILQFSFSAIARSHLAATRTRRTRRARLLLLSFALAPAPAHTLHCLSLSFWHTHRHSSHLVEH
jgi:hypothetical protein